MLRLLVIEDDEPIAAILQRGLKLAGYDVVVAHDGQAARARWAEGGFAAVLLDVMLPGASGLELAGERRRAGDDTPIMLLTARDDDSVRCQAREVGVDALMVKPFVYRELLVLLADLVTRRSESVARAPNRLDE